MPRTNPSQTLTLARLDQLVDLVMKGEKYLTKKEKPLWPSPKEAWQTGLMSWNDCQSYFYGRGNLRNNLVSRRAQKLAENLERLRVQHRSDNDFVWKVKHGWGYTWGFVCASNEAAARQIGHTMFVTGRADRLQVTVDRLTVDRVSLGGWDTAAKHNLELISEVRRTIEEAENRIKQYQDRVDADRALVENLMGAVMLGGDLGGSDEAAKAG